VGATHKEQLIYGIRKWIDPIRVAGPNASYPADGGGLIGSSLDGHKSNHSYMAIGRRKNPEGKFMETKYRKIKSLKFLYEVNEDGVVRNIKSKHPLKTQLIRGYKFVYIPANASDVGYVQVARLICECWNGDIPGPDYEVDHIDRDITNNSPSNLRWVTHQQNCLNRDFTNIRKHIEEYNKTEEHANQLRGIQDSCKKGIVVWGHGITKEFDSSISFAEWYMKQDFCDSTNINTVQKQMCRVSSGKRKMCYGFKAKRIVP
jgi:hypothetical protein